VQENVRSKWPHVARLPAMIERFCVLELAGDTEAVGAGVPGSPFTHSSREK
jgi:hypothetical protein